MTKPYPLAALCLLACVLACFTGCGKKTAETEEDRYVTLMNSGKNYLAQGQPEKALEVYGEAARLAPTEPDVHLNLANANLLQGNAEAAIQAADRALQLDPNSAAALYVKGCAYLRLSNFEEALKALETARQLEPAEPALAFQLGLAHFNLKHWDEAIALFTEVVTAEPEHPSAHYQLSQALRRAGIEDEAQAELQVHQAIAARNEGVTMTPARLEKSRFTEPRVPFRLEQPEKEGIAVRFTVQTEAAFGSHASKVRGPVGLIDPGHRGAMSLFAREQDAGFRLFANTNGKFSPVHGAHPEIPEANYSDVLVGDLNNDRVEDVIVLGDRGLHLFRFSTNGTAVDMAGVSRLQGLATIDGALADLDFTGKLDLLAVTAVTNELRLFRQYTPFVFTDVTGASGIPSDIGDAATIIIDDWPKNEQLDVIVARQEGAPALLEKQRGGPLVRTNVAGWTSGRVIATGDLNNDLRVDLAAAREGKVQIHFQGMDQPAEIPLSLSNVRKIYLQDYDNDGWLDLWAAGDGLQVFRNLGQSGFQDRTRNLGLDAISGQVAAVAFADFDGDCDSEALLTMDNGNLIYLRNDGGNANGQLKVRLLGNRSNASGLGTKVQVSSGRLRLERTVHQLPVEIGVGKADKIESFVTHWFNLAVPSSDVPVDCQSPVYAIELTLPEGSCPYMYVWDGKEFRFVTDLLGAAPAGLPVAEGRYIESDPDEYAWIGTPETFKPRDGMYLVQITEELREVLFLDEAKLAVVDHPAGMEVHPLDKLVPGKPFPPSALATFGREQPLRKATTLSGAEVTERLTRVDQLRVSPEQLRIPQQRGLAELHGLILDFGPLDSGKAQSLVLNGWLRFGGGMANINGSHDPSLPFPFPSLEAEVNGKWVPVEMGVGAPAGKTKTIVADLTGKLPRGAQRLKLQTAFEIHWDRIALLENMGEARTRVVHVEPTATDLHWRGFSEFEDLSWDWPLTPDYNLVTRNPKWRITPEGWCTRYGDVAELIARRDEGLLIMNGGDELTLSFAENALPEPIPGYERQFFIYTDGWDKDSDFHVATGNTVEPLPWHGMNDQRYGKDERPAFPSDDLHRKYNTRWVSGRVVARGPQSTSQK